MRRRGALWMGRARAAVGARAFGGNRARAGPRPIPAIVSMAAFPSPAASTAAPARAENAPPAASR